MTSPHPSAIDSDRVAHRSEQPSQSSAGRRGGTNYTWTISFHERSIVARPLIAIGTRLFKQALAAQADALTHYLDERPEDELPPSL